MQLERLLISEDTPEEGILCPKEPVFRSCAAWKPDEELIRLHQDLSVPQAGWELLIRHYAYVRRLIVHESKRWGLGRPDIEDAQQEAVFYFCLALNGFDRADPAESTCFRGYLRIVVRRRFLDFVRLLRRREAHYASLSSSPSSLEETDAFEDKNSDPLDHLAQRELLKRLHEVLDTLPKKARYVCDQLAAGQSLRATAAHLHLTYGQGKRLRQRTLALLAQSLKNWTDWEE